MASKFADAPIGATHYRPAAVGNVYYKFDGHVWKFFSMGAWNRCDGNKPCSPVERIPPHAGCCGTTCDRNAVSDYVTRLEAVAKSAQLVAYGALAGDIRGDALRRALQELGNG